MDKGRGLMSEQIGKGSSRLSDQVSTASQTMRRVAEQSRTEGNTQQARLAEQAADRGERFSSYLQDVEPERLIDDAEDFARRQPWVIAGAGLLIGFALARSLKASSGRRYAARTQPSRYSGNGEAAWSSSPGAPRDTLAGVAARQREASGEYV
jgi:ElaB/YqjD/DUF883 family membrane-anchored ribosome-binding protein